MSTRTQREKILAHLKRAPITALQALKRYRCLRLAARVGELKASGYDIHARMVKVGRKRVARYALMH